MAGPPAKNLFSGAGKAPERIVFYREGGPFKPQSRDALSWDDELRCTLKNPEPKAEWRPAGRCRL